MCPRLGCVLLFSLFFAPAVSRPVFAQETLPDLFRGASKGQRIKLPAELLPSLKKQIPARCAEDANDTEIVKKFIWDVRAIDLNGRSQRAIAVQGAGCFSGANNSDLFIWRKNGAKYELILNDVMIAFGFLGSRTNGYRDIVTDHHMSAGVYFRTLFKFDGHEYQPSRCMVAARRCQEKESIKEHWLREWQITPMACDSTEYPVPPTCLKKKTR